MPFNKKTFPKIVALIVGIVVLAPIVPMAHPADEMMLDYDRDACLLTIKIVHDSQDFNRHFIEKVWVSVNKKEIIRQCFSSQDDGGGLTLQYKIFNLKNGDIITVECRCNIYGRQTVSLEIE